MYNGFGIRVDGMRAWKTCQISKTDMPLELLYYLSHSQPGHTMSRRPDFKNVPQRILPSQHHVINILKREGIVSIQCWPSVLFNGIASMNEFDCFRILRCGGFAIDCSTQFGLTTRHHELLEPLRAPKFSPVQTSEYPISIDTLYHTCHL